MDAERETRRAFERVAEDRGSCNFMHSDVLWNFHAFPFSSGSAQTEESQRLQATYLAEAGSLVAHATIMMQRARERERVRKSVAVAILAQVWLTRA